MYELFLDAVSSEGRLTLLQKKQSVAKEVFSLAGNESSLLPARVFSFLQDRGIDPKDLGHIYVVNGPGSFTGIRTICLFVNTLAYIYPHLTLTPISFFDLYKDYPIVKQSSRRDVFVKKQKDDIIEVVMISQLKAYLAGTQQWQGSMDMSLWDLSDISLQAHYDEIWVIAGIDLSLIHISEPTRPY